MKRPPLDPDLLRDRLADEQGKRYWRSLEELADDPVFHEMLKREFPTDASTWTDPVSRRRFLTIMGASLALAGLANTGCRPPAGTIMPYVRQPENLVPGKPLFYATAMTISGFATGLLVESHEGRPTKIEGNEKHPASLGATTVHQQAAILGMYDPDRSQAVMFRGQPRSWADAVEELRRRLSSEPRRQGQRVAVLAEAINSPTLVWQKNAFLSAYPEARWFVYEPVHRDNAVAGAQLAFGHPYHSYHKVEKADIIVALDADFLGQGPACLADARAFASRRRETGGKAGMNRLYVIETDVSITGSRADHRLALRPSQIETLARALAGKLGVPGLPAISLDAEMDRWAEAIVKDLTQKAGKPRTGGTTLVLTGDGQPPAVHALVHAINHRLGNLGQTVLFTDPLPSSLSASNTSLDALLSAIRAAEIDTLLVLGGNPAYTAPVDLGLAELLTRQLARQPREKWLAVHVGAYFDETARLCHWHIPQTHFLEEWSDAIAFDGTVSIVQPLIAPLFGSKSLHEVLAAITPTSTELSSFDTRNGYEIVRGFWKSYRPASAEPFERYWQKALHDGVMDGSALPTLIPTIDAALGRALEEQAGSTRSPDGTVELVFAPDPAVYDGRFANNGWLQEWPKPITKLSWDNALLMSEKTAKDLGLVTRVGMRRGGEHGDSIADVAFVQHGKRILREVPIWIVPGHADGAVTLHLGYGRTVAGKVGSRLGFNANELRQSNAAWFLSGVRVSKVRGKRYPLACQQAHHSMEGRDPVRSATLGAYREDPHFATRHNHGHAAHKRHELPTLHDGKDHPYTGYKWGMAVDLGTCIGCGACVVACQAENNIPIVGKQEVRRGREMHWLRIDRYFETPKKATDHTEALHVHFQPVMCQHCENAPCEVVCPVEATVHGDEGTNDMVYNRCVGTRYCANNCPYKVRRFNFLRYADYDTPVLKMLYNPDVTVRSRGVMEKCTFCIQRIARGRIESAKEALDGDRKRKDPHDRKVQGKDVPYIRDGEVVTACQASCPTEAIIFGDLNDKFSKVAKLHDSALSYDLLGELGVRPRVFYLAAIGNPNPELEVK